MKNSTTINCGNCPDYGFPNFVRYDKIYNDVSIWESDASTNSNDDDGEERYAGLTGADWIAIALGVGAACFAMFIFYSFRDRLMIRSVPKDKASTIVTSNSANNPLV